jgi:ketosteroid isomerase-like protein
MAEDLEVHVSGNHPLSGHYRGREEAFGYIGRVGAWTGGEGGFAVDAVLTDEEGHAAAIVTGTAFHDGVKFERPIVHLFTLQDGAMLSFRDLPFDQHAEDRFWAGA